ncbi:reverse transcriptase family protein, partial [Salmonella enterica subsp. enterica serovar Derby]|nr:reverse transcriptase family protein [Salmonella enterica subsp. enterica serovar Derby]
MRRRSQRQSWIKYVSTISSRTSAKVVWDHLRKIRGSYQSHHVSILNTGNTIIADLQGIADCLGATFASVSSCQGYPPSFQFQKARLERSILSFRPYTSAGYNSLFTLVELQDALRRSGHTAPGPDEIHYEMLRHLSPQSLAHLLFLFNRIWCEHVFPDSWRVAIVLPFHKPGKDPAIPSNYRPIALTSCLCKLLERMVNARLMWFLETNKILSPHQCGFRRHRSSIDHLLRLETSIREAFVRRQHLVSVFFDLEKAYDRAWRYVILRDLHSCGLRGNLPLFIEGFLQNRRFQV